MDYNELLEIYKNIDAPEQVPPPALRKVLSPSALNNAEELENIISSRFKYTGPGKWTKIIRDNKKTE